MELPITYHVSLKDDGDIDQTTLSSPTLTFQYLNSTSQHVVQSLQATFDDGKAKVVLMFDCSAAVHAWAQSVKEYTRGAKDDTVRGSSWPLGAMSPSAVQLCILAGFEPAEGPRGKQNAASRLASWRMALNELPLNAELEILLFDLQNKFEAGHEDEVRTFIQLVSTVVSVKARGSEKQGRPVQFRITGCSEREQQILGAGLNNLVEPGSAPQGKRDLPLWWNVARLARHPDIPRSNGPNVIARSMKEVGYVSDLGNASASDRGKQQAE